MPQTERELLEALKDLQRQYSDMPDVFLDWSKARTAITRAEQAERVERVGYSSRILAWAKQSEIDTSRMYGGSFNAWLEKYDCNVQLFDLPQSTPQSAAAPLTDEQIENICVETWLKTGPFPTNIAAYKAISRAIEAAHNIRSK